MWRRCAVAAVALAGCACLVWVQPEPRSLREVSVARAGDLLPVRLRPKPTGERSFVDSAGRERYFHGTNAIGKGPPWIPATDVYSPDLSLVAQDFEIMRGMGLSMLRLGTMWPGVEPTRGQYNETYMDELEKIVTMAASYGIYTLLDMHQDVLSEYFCGEGIPAWAVQDSGIGSRILKFPRPLQAKGYATYPEPKSGGAAFPTRQECAKHSWPSYYGTKDVAAAYEALYTNVNGTADAWAGMWRHVAQRFKGNPNVLGLELINEPFAGDFYDNPLIMVPWPNPMNADRTRLQPAYDRINTAVRQVDTERLIFFAGVTWDDAGPGFTHAPGGDEFADRSVLAYHYYEPPQKSTTFQVKHQLAGARRLKTGIFLTETCMGHGGGVSLFDAANDQLQSWAYWEYKGFCRETTETRASPSQNGAFGACKTGIGPGAYSYKTYPQAVQGNATRFSFNDTAQVFSLTYAVDPTVALPTEIRVARHPGHTWPKLQFTITPPTAAAATFDNTTLVLSVAALPAATHGMSITVEVHQ